MYMEAMLDTMVANMDHKKDFLHGYFLAPFRGAPCETKFGCTKINCCSKSIVIIGVAHGIFL